MGFFVVVVVVVVVFYAFTTVFHSINPSDNSLLSHSVLSVVFLPYWSFHLYLFIKVSLSRVTGPKAPTNYLNLPCVTLPKSHLQTKERGRQTETEGQREENKQGKKDGVITQ